MRPSGLAVTFIMALSLLGCGARLAGLIKRPIYRPAATTDQDAIDVYNSGKDHKTDSAIFQTPSGNIEIRVFQNRVVASPSKAYALLHGTRRGSGIIFQVVVRNNSTRHTFEFFNLIDWTVVDSNGRLWDYLSYQDASNFKQHPPDCVPGSEVAAEIFFSSAYYSSLESFPSSLTLKINGNFIPDSDSTQFEENLVFERILSQW